jgi:hypothetical protein
LETAQSFEDSDNSDDSSEQDANTADCDEIIQRVFGSYDNLSGTDVRTKEALVQSIGMNSEKFIDRLCRQLFANSLFKQTATADKSCKQPLQIAFTDSLQLLQSAHIFFLTAYLQIL